jgi:hypothetical protein
MASAIMALEQKALLTDCPRRARQQLSKRAGAEYARRFATSVQYHTAAAL